MKRTAIRRALPVLAALAALAVAAVLVAGCENAPEPSHLGNPFDPDADTGGDALQLVATISGNAVTLTWNDVKGHGITEYNVFRSEQRDTGYQDLAVVPASQAVSNFYIDRYPPASRRLWYLVQAVAADGTFSLASYVTPATVESGPSLVVGDTVTTLASRYTGITAVAGFGDTLLVTTDDTFDTALRIAVPDPDAPVSFVYDFGTAPDSTVFKLKALATNGLAYSDTTFIDLRVRFAPTLGLVDASPNKLTRRVNDLAVGSEGVVRMRFAPTEADLAGAAWVPGDDVYPAYELADSANEQEIWGEFEGDFGYNTTRKLTVRPDPLLNATFSLQVPQNRVVSSLSVVGKHAAGATQMRVSESLDFATVPWEAYADTARFQLSPGEGRKTVYAQYRNDWNESIILSDYCIYVSQGIDVAITAPAPGNVLPSGATMLVRGTSSPGTVATEIDSVRLDLGDGAGFREVVGKENWQLTWTIPDVDADTPVNIRARAWAHSATESFVVTDVVSVTLSDVTVKIQTPVAGAVHEGGTTLNIGGTAGPILGGAPIDSVTVTVDGQPLVVSGTEIWSTSWETPVVASPVPAVIAATAWAGGRTAEASVEITLTPSP